MFLFTVFCVPYKSVLMPRRGWRAVEVPEGWLQVIRGPRPASVQWPRAVPNSNRESRKKVAKVDLPERPVAPRPARPARSPDLVSAETAQEVQRLENAVSALGEDNPLAKPLVSALKAAKSKLEAPIGERLDSCQRFLERARKRVTSAESAIAEAVAERDRLVAELAEGEKRMERLREEAHAVPPPRDVVGDEFLDDVAQMRQEILELRRFRDRFPASALRGAEGPLVLENIPAMPETPHQLETWMSDRNADLRSALASKSDPAILSQLADMMSKAAAKFSQLEERELQEVGQRSDRFAPY